MQHCFAYHYPVVTFLKSRGPRCFAESIVNRAYGYGLQPHDLLLDPLVLTLASGEDSARQTLRTLQLYKEKNLASQQ